MISIDDHPPPDPSSSDYHNHYQQQVSHDLKINNGERAPASASVSDIDLLKPTDVNLDDTNNRLPNFSIRDYVFGSRCKDNITCNWPFSDESLQLCLDYGVKNFLPPFESLDSLRSNSSVSNQEIINSLNDKSKHDHQSHIEEEDLAQTKPHKSHHPASSQPSVVNFVVSEIAMASKVCPVCKTFSSSSNTTLNAHIDQCLSEESKSNIKWTANPSKIMVKNRIKPRKTRLMVEIYKTAPQCTVEELDRRNGTNWATNSNFPDQEFECQEEEFVDHEGAVYIDKNGTKVRILSMPEEEKGNKIVMEKKKKKVYVQMKNSKKLSSLKPDHTGVSKAKSGEKENVVIERSVKKAEVHKQLNNLAITRPPWACSKRTVLSKKFNGKEVLVESEKSSLQYSKKATTQLKNGIKFASLNKPNLLSATQENNSGSKINLKRKSSAFKKSNENNDPFQNSLKHKSRIEEEDMENGFEVNKKKSITSKSTSDGDSLESTRTEIPSHSIHFQGSFMGLSNSLDDEFSKLVSQPDNKFDLQESMEDDMDDIDPIPIPGPPGSFLPPSPGGDIISEELQGNSSLTTTSRLQSTENHHHHHHHHMMNRDFMSESPNSTISSPMADHTCCCSRKEAVFSKSIASYPQEESVVLRETEKSIKFPVYRDFESAIISPSAAPVLRLMGKNLTVVNTDDDHVDQVRPMSHHHNHHHHHHHHHQQLHNIQNDKNSFFHGYPSQHPAIFNHNQNNLRNLAHIHPFHTMFPSRNGCNFNKEMISIDDSSGNEAGDSYVGGVSPVLHNGRFQSLSHFNGGLGRWGCTRTGSSSILHPTSHGSPLAFTPNIRSSTSYYPPSYS